jgi:DNA-binding SARP family transcriptional activator
MRRLASGLWSAFWLAVLLVGLPAVLVRYVGWPLPDHSPTESDWQRWVAQPLTHSTLIGTAALIGWLLWALLVYAVAVEVLTWMRRAVSWLGRLRLPELPTPMQATASGMLGATVFGIPAVTTHAADVGVTQPPTPAPPTLQAAPTGTAGPSPPADEPTTGHDVPADRPAKSPARIVVALPDGGWVTGETATAIASMASLVWLRRRRHYLPRPPTSATRDDADLTPQSDTVVAIQDGLHRRHTGDEDEPGPADIPQMVPGAAVAAVVGEQAGRPVRPDDLPLSGVGLTGAGAAAAARGLLVAALLTGRHRDQQPRLVTTAADLQSLLGPAAGDRHRETPGLAVADDLDDAAAYLEHATLERRRTPFAHASQDPAGAAARTSPRAEPEPLLLVTGCPTDPETARHLADLLTFAAPLHITAVLLGDWPHGTTWHVDPAGAIDPADTPTTQRLRLSVLTSTATTDLLGLLREAHQSRAHPAPAPTPPPPTGHPDNEGRAPAAAGQHHHDAQATVIPAGSGHPPARPRLRLRVLGALSIHDTSATGAALHIQRSAAVQILVFLAAHRDGATTGQLAAALWPELRPHVAANRLYTPISSLRTALKKAAGTHVLVRDGERYRLDNRHIDVDLWRLHAAVDAAATALDLPDRRRALHAIADTYTGDLAADQHWPWLAVPREAARRHAVDAYAMLAAIQTDPQSAVALLQNAIRIDPYNEELHRRAMRSYAAAGDSPAARRLLAAFTSRLADIDMETGEATR